MIFLVELLLLGQGLVQLALLFCNQEIVLLDELRLVVDLLLCQLDLLVKGGFLGNEVLRL